MSRFIMVSANPELCIRNNDPDSLRDCLKYCCDEFDIKGVFNGKTLLQKAVENKQYQIVKVLIEFGIRE